MSRDSVNVHHQTWERGKSVISVTQIGLGMSILEMGIFTHSLYIMMQKTSRELHLAD